MAITTLNTASAINDQNPVTVTAAMTLTAGSNRMLVVLVPTEDGSSMPDFGVTYGGIDMRRQDSQPPFVVTTIANTVRYFTLPEADLATLTDTTSYNIVATPEYNTDGVGIAGYLLAGVDQYTAIIGERGSAGAATNATTASLTPEVNNCAAITSQVQGDGGVGVAGTSDHTLTSTIFEEVDLGSGFGFDAGIELDLGTAAAETFKWTLDASVNRIAVGVLFLRPSASSSADTWTTETFTGTDGDFADSRRWFQSRFGNNSGSEPPNLITADIQSNAWEVAGSTADPHGATIESILQLDDDREMLFKFQSSSITADSWQRLRLRQLANGDTLDIEIDVAADDVIVRETVSGTPSDLTSDVASGLGDTVAHWMRAQVIGTAVKVRWWDDGGAEPGTWDLTTTTTVDGPGPIALEWEYNSTSGTLSATFDDVEIVSGGPVAAPVLSLTSKTDTQIVMEWTAVSGAASYDVERDGSVIATGEAGLSYTDTPLSASTEYTHRVRAKF